MIARRQYLSARGCRDEVITAGSDLLAIIKVVAAAAEISVQRDGDEVLRDVFGIDLVAGEPPGPVRRARPSGSREGAAVGGRKDDDRFVFGDGPGPGLANIRHPRNVPPGAFAGLRLDGLVDLIEIELKEQVENHAPMLSPLLREFNLDEFRSVW